MLKSILMQFAALLRIEIVFERTHRSEQTTLSSDWTLGYALRQLVELLVIFLNKLKIYQLFKGKLLGPVLREHFLWRQLVDQRRRLVDNSRKKLLEMLEEMTTGTKEAKRECMSPLIIIISNMSKKGIRTSVERLLIIQPEVQLVALLKDENRMELVISCRLL